MATLITLSDMIKSIETLLRGLKEKHVEKHVLCPSSRSVIPELKDLIKNPIEIIDERSAGYVATGICEEIGAPVVVWCADNDSYRNLTSSLTEAYYRKLPILVVALACDSNINQAVNPQDTIRYYANNPIVGSNGTIADIKLAMEYLYEDVKGPVYLSLGKFSENTNDPQDVYVHEMDVTFIAGILPSDACVHFGSSMSYECNHLQDVVLRNDHVTKDGNLSMLIGSSVVKRDQLHIGVFTSEEIAYDINMLGNRHVGNNIVIICLIQKDQSPVIKDFAQSMQWDCKRLMVAEIETIKNGLVINSKPQYIEVVL